MTTHLSPAQTPSSEGAEQDPHRSLHSETGGTARGAPGAVRGIP